MLITADLHLTDNPRDSYRWDLFSWLIEQCKKTNSHEVLILGDITDKKDRHSAVLVNRLVENMAELVKVADVWMLAGNHDYIDPKNPFFRFLELQDCLQFVTEPYEQSFNNKNCLLLPHTRDPDTEWKKLKFADYDYIFCHQTFKGSVASNGHTLEGMLSKYFSKRGFKGKVYSGDIHVPQHIGDVEYVGSPYHVHFGDNFKPRVLHLDHRNGKTTDLFFDAPRRVVLTLDTPKAIVKAKLKPGDQVKVRLTLGREELVDWESIKKDVEARCVKTGVVLSGVELYAVKEEAADTEGSPSVKTSMSPDAVLQRFIEKENIPDYVQTIGQSLMES